MPAATDDIKTVEDAIWALLLARSEFVALVKAGNRVRQNNPARQRNADVKVAKLPADFPEVTIDRGAYRRAPYRNTVTFGTFDAADGCPRIEDGSQEFEITIVIDADGDIKAGQVWAELEAAIDAGGPQLGLPTIVRLIEEFSATSQVTTEGRAAGVKRRVITGRLRVAMRKHVLPE